ncbi:MAG: HAD hydrolase family protein [Muribaculaceae bacterium]|nr:HAD hydrolase family protein [Muribaculaceae bacterium]
MSNNISDITFGHSLLKSKVLYVSDLDGTLLDPHSHITPRSAEMLNTAIARGTLFTIATARTPGTVVDIMKGVNMQLPGVVMTGAALFDFQTHRYSRICCIDADTVKRMIPIYRRHNVSTFIYIISPEQKLDCYHIGELNQFEKTFIAERCHNPFKTFHVPANGESVLPESFDNTILLFSVQPWDKAYALWQEIKDNPQIPCYPLCYHDAFGPEWGELEMFGPQTSKAAAVEAIASDTGAGRIVAFGDNVNDIPLFELADEGIAVQGAIDRLKDVATAVIGSNADDSVAEFILKHSKSVSNKKC